MDKRIRPILAMIVVLGAASLGHGDASTRCAFDVDVIQGSYSSTTLLAGVTAKYSV